MAVSTLLIEGSFAELAEELAQYLDTLEENADVLSSIESELGQIREIDSQETANTSAQKYKDDILKKIITKATVLNKAPERGMSGVRDSKMVLTNGVQNSLLLTTC